MKKTVFIFMTVLIWAGLVWAGIVWAEVQRTVNTKNSAEEVYVLDEVVVTATRDKESIYKIPANVSVITEDDIKTSGASTVLELFDKLEGIYVRSYSGNPAKSIIDMRGFGGENPYGKTLILLNGMKLNRPDMSGINWMQVPINTIERIEVVRGASSALYGDAALGGVINIITKKGDGTLKTNAAVLAGSYGFQNESVSVTASHKKWDYALNGENNFSDGYRDRAKFSSQSGGFYIGYKVSDLLNLSFEASLNKTDYQMPGALTKAQMKQNRQQHKPEASKDDGKDKYTNLNLGIKSLLGFFGSLDIQAIYSKKELQYNMASYSTYSNVDIDTYALMPKYVLTRDIVGFKNKLTIGLDWYHEPFSQNKFTTRERTAKKSMTDLTRNSLAWYIRNEFTLLDPLILSLGFRHDRTSINGKNTDFINAANNWDDDKLHSANAYEAGLTYLIGKTSNIYAKYGTVFRIPFLDEQASYYGFKTDLFNKELEKEIGKTMEIGTQINPAAGLKIGASLFRTDMENEIEWSQADGKNINMDKTRHEGAEISGSWQINELAKIYGNFTYHNAKFIAGAYQGNELPLVPRKMANLGVNLNLPFDFSLRPEIRYVDESYLSSDKDNNAEKLGDYTLYNLYIFYRPQTDQLQVSCFAGVENLTDVEYSSFGMDGGAWSPASYYPMPGIQYKAGVSFDF
jgi:iron complex outermembrane recepter protein